MSVARAYVGVACLDGFIYAVGGWNDETGALASVERYNIKEVRLVMRLSIWVTCEHKLSLIQ